jgi:hypothetical protein
MEKMEKMEKIENIKKIKNYNKIIFNEIMVKNYVNY